MTKKRIALIWVATLLVAISVLFPIDISQPQPDTYTFRIGNTAMAHDADYECDGVNDHVEFQQLLDALPAAVGGRIEVEAGYYVWGTGETVTRNISNVTIIGVGGLVSFDGDDTTAIFTAGDDSWTFENIVTDAGGIDLGATTDYLVRNVLVDTTFYAFVTDLIDIEDHGARHESGGSDAIKLDDLATPDDNTDLNSTTGYHGLLPKLAGNVTLFLRSDGTWQAVGGGTGDMLKSVYDTDDDGLIDTAAGGTEWDSSAVTGVAYINAGAWTYRDIGIADTNILVVDGTVASTEHCRLTANGIEGLTSAELLAALSGEATAAFDWNAQNLINVGTVDGRDVSVDGTKLDGIESGADVTDADNVAAAGALMDSDTDNVDDTHINWGSGAGQVDADDVAESGSRYWAGESGADVTDAANVNSAGAVMESDYNATTFLYATLDNTPETKTPAEVLAILSGEATAAFDWNAQNLINVGTVDGRDVSTDGTKLDGIEAGADVTDAANVAAAGALMDADTDNVDDTHINWGSGAGQVDADDVAESGTRFWAGESGADVTDAANVASAGAVMESDYDATTFLYATSDDTPQPKTPAEVLAILSGDAGASFDWNAQDLTNVGDVDGVDISVHESDGSAHQSNIITITFLIDGGGSAITTGQKGHLEIPFACTITGWTLLADQSGSIVIDVWKDTYANFPPTVADTITGSEKPTLATAQKNQDLTLSTWTTAVSAGDILAFNIDSASTVERVTLSIRATKT